MWTSIQKLNFEAIFVITPIYKRITKNCLEIKFWMETQIELNSLRFLKSVALVKVPSELARTILNKFRQSVVEKVSFSPPFCL